MTLFSISFFLNICKKNWTSARRPGGKYGPADEVTKEQVEQLALRDDLKRASNVAATALQVNLAIDPDWVITIT